MPSRVEATHIIARLLSSRKTSLEEIPQLIESVFQAFHDASMPLPIANTIHRSARAATVAKEIEAPVKKRRGRPPGSTRRIEFREEEVTTLPMPAPALIRRAKIVAPPVTTSQFLETPRGMLRGVVKWFDAKTRRGALRLPGFGGDVMVESAQFTEAGISRLYKGQEVDAVMEGSGDSAHLVRLSLPGGGAPVISSGSTVRGRHAKPVIVEMKREGLRRASARAEAEQLLRPARR